MLKRAIGLGWLVGVAALVAAPIVAVRTPPPAPEGLSCWYDPAHDVWPLARVVRDGGRIRVARRSVHGAYAEVVDGFAWFGNTLRGDLPLVWFRGEQLLIDGAPYHRASCAIDRAPLLTVEAQDGKFLAGLTGQALVEVGSFLGPCLDAPPVSDRVVRRIACAHGQLVVSRRAEGIVVEELSNGTTTVWHVPGVPMVALAEPLPALVGGDRVPVGLRRPGGSTEVLVADTSLCWPTAPVAGAGLSLDYDCTLDARGEDPLQRVVIVVASHGLQVSRRYARRAASVTTTAL